MAKCICDGSKGRKSWFKDEIMYNLFGEVQQRHWFRESEGGGRA